MLGSTYQDDPNFRQKTIHHIQQRTSWKRFAPILPVVNGILNTLIDGHVLASLKDDRFGPQRQQQIQSHLPRKVDLLANTLVPEELRQGCDTERRIPHAVF